MSDRAAELATALARLTEQAHRKTAKGAMTTAYCADLRIVLEALQDLEKEVDAADGARREEGYRND